jgi:hypothetical protein
LNIGQAFRVSIENRVHDDVAKIMDLITKNTFQFLYGHRRFCVTAAGFMGLIPSGSKSGDLVCIIEGAPTPFILRSETNGNYSLVGECYMHGMMDGGMVTGEQSLQWLNIT